MFKKLRYKYISQEAIALFFIVLIFVFFNSALVGLTGIISSAFIFFLLSILGNRRPLYIFGAMLIAILIDDFFEDQLGPIYFFDKVCQITCMEIFNMGFLALFLNLFLNKKVGFLFKHINGHVAFLMLLVIYVVINFLFQEFEATELLRARRFVQFFLFYLMTRHILSTEKDLAFIVTILIVFTFTSMVIGAFLIGFGFFGRTYIASLLIFSIPITGGLLYGRAIGNIVPIYNILKEMLMIFGAGSLLVLSESRRNLLFLLFFTIYTIIKLKLYRRLIFSFILIIPIFLVFNFLLTDRNAERIEVTVNGVRNIVTGNDLESTWDFYTGRDVLFEVSWEVFLEHPIFGIGIERSYRAIEEKTGEAVRPHNFFLQLLVETGILGVALYLLFLFGFLIAILRSRKLCLITGNLALKGLIDGMIFFIIVAHVISFFGLYMLYDKFYWFVFALGAVLVKIAIGEYYQFIKLSSISSERRKLSYSKNKNYQDIPHLSIN